MPRRLVPAFAAAVIAVVGLAGLIYGVLLATTLAPPALTVGKATVPGGVPVLDTATGVLDLDGPQMQVQATAASGGPVFLGIARADDVTAYLADVSRTEITRVGDDGALTTVRAGARPSLPNPSGVDIWVAVRSGTGNASLTWPDTAGPWRLVVAGDGSASAPSQITLSWTRRQRSNSAPAVITVGVLLLVGGLVGLLVLRGGRDRDEADDDQDGPGGAPPRLGAPQTVPTGMRTPAAGLPGSEDSATRIIPRVGTSSVPATGPRGIPGSDYPGSDNPGSDNPGSAASRPRRGAHRSPGPRSTPTAGDPTGPDEPEVPA